MRIFVLTANYELRVSRKSHLRDHPNNTGNKREKKVKDIKFFHVFDLQYTPIE
jgi:hypothetical protein